MQVLDVQHYRARVCGCLVDAQQHLATNHQTRDLGLVRLASDQFARVLAAPQHCDGVGQFQHFAQLMRDKDNRLALLYQAAQNDED